RARGVVRPARHRGRECRRRCRRLGGPDVAGRMALHGGPESHGHVPHRQACRPGDGGRRRGDRRHLVDRRDAHASLHVGLLREQGGGGDAPAPPGRPAPPPPHPRQRPPPPPPPPPPPRPPP